jgi:hypothetical protein
MRVLKDLFASTGILLENMDKFHNLEVEGPPKQGVTQTVIPKLIEGEQKFMLKRIIDTMYRKYRQVLPLLKTLANGIRTTVPMLNVPTLKRLFPVGKLTEDLATILDVQQKYMEVKSNDHLGGTDWSIMARKIKKGF